MGSPLFNQFNHPAPVNPMLQRLMNFKKSFSGNPQQMVQEMLNSGKISQAQVNKYAQQANEIYRQMKGLM